MTQYNFTINIEKRMPTTGEVFFVDRMTSDYAQAHHFDVDAFIESVFQKWQDCETIGFRETREALRRQWDKTMGERNPRGNASLYPNKNGEKHPALMEVWHKAGDYWRRGLRLGDVLPAVVPPCKITRTEDGWIALFPKDMHLLEQSLPAPVGERLRVGDRRSGMGAVVGSVTSTTAEPAEQEQPEACPEVLPQESQEEAPTPSPLAQMQAEMEALRQENARLQAEREAAQREAEAMQHQREQEQERQRRDQELQALVERELQRQLHRSSSRRISDGHLPDIDPANSHHPTDEPAQPATTRRKPTVRRWLKPMALAAASVVACVVIYETGLLIPMGLIGLATSGLVK